MSLVPQSIKVSERSLILFVCVILILIIPVVLLVILVPKSLLLLLIMRGYFLGKLRPSRSFLLVLVVVRKHSLKSHGFFLSLHESTIKRVVILGLAQDPLVPAVDIVIVLAIATMLSLLAVLVVHNGMEDAVILKFILLVVRSSRTLLVAPPIRVDQRVKGLGTLLPEVNVVSSLREVFVENPVGRA